MRVEIQQAVAQTPNVDRVQINVSNPQVAEAMKHAQNLAEKTEAQKKAEVVVEISKSESIESVKDEERKRKALTTRKEKRNEGNEEKNKEEKEEKEKLLPESGENQKVRKIDLKA